MSEEITQTPVEEEVVQRPIEEIKADIEAWVPKLIQQIVDFRAGNEITATRLNELFNLLIQQGDDSIGLLTLIKEYIDAIIIETGELTDEIVDATDAANSAAELMRGYQSAVLLKVDELIGELQSDMDATLEALSVSGEVITETATVYEKINGKLELLEDNIEFEDPIIGLDADTLGGKSASYFAKAADLTQTNDNLTTRTTETYNTFSGSVIASGSYVTKEVKNGWCHLQLALTPSSAIASTTVILSGLPTPYFAWYQNIACVGDTYYNPVRVQLGTNGQLSIIGGVAGKTYYCNISYQINT